MEGRERAELKDRILQTIMEQTFFPEGNYYQSWITEHRLLNYFKGILQNDEIPLIIREIQEFNENLVYTNEDTLKTRNEYKVKIHTQKFLNIGGFVNQYESELEAETTRRLLEAEERDALTITRGNERRKYILLKWQTKVFWPVFVLGLVGGVYSLFQIYYSFNAGEKDAELINRIEQLETNQKKLEKGFEIEVKDLKDKLYKADMMISIYESDSLKTN